MGDGERVKNNEHTGWRKRNKQEERQFGIEGKSLIRLRFVEGTDGL